MTLRNIMYVNGFWLLRDEYAQFQDLAEVMGISSDPPEVNAEFAKARQTLAGMALCFHTRQ